MRSFSSATKYPLRGIRLVVAFLLRGGFSGWIGLASMTGGDGFVISWGCFSSGVIGVGVFVIAGGVGFVALGWGGATVIADGVVVRYYYLLNCYYSVVRYFLLTFPSSVYWHVCLESLLLGQ